jgi:phosphodiesterase/alkaline phosphatase D-like protein
VALAVAGVLFVSAAPALANEGLGVVGTFGAPGSGAGEFSFVPSGRGEEVSQPGSGVAVNSVGDVYIADTGNGRVEWFNAAGQYLGQFNGSGTLGNESGKKAPEPLSKPEGIAVDNDLGSPSAGDVYVGDRSQGVVDKFSATGEFIFQLKVGPISSVAIDPSGHVWVREYNGTNTSVQEFSNAVENTSMAAPMEVSAPSGSLIAVDSEENLYLSQFTDEVHKYTKAATEVGTVCEDCNAHGLAIDPADNDLFVDEATFIAQFGPFGEPFEAPVHVSKPGSLGSGAGIAVGPTNHEIYVADTATNTVVVFALGPPPEKPETLKAKEVKANTALLEGELNPHGERGEVKYHFVYSTEGTCTGEANAGTAPVPAGTRAEASKALVSTEATGLSPLEEYTYCLVAENRYEKEIGTAKTFTTTAAVPAIISETASSISPEKVKLEAAINPENQKTSYLFEYASSEAAIGTAGATTVEGAPPAPELEGFSPEGQAASVTEVPLEVTESVYYRVVATNSTGTIDGRVQAYTKLPLVESASSSAVTSLSAKLEATVYPDFVKTKYAFEYAAGTDGKQLLEKGEGTLVPHGAGVLPGRRPEPEEEESVPPTPVSAEFTGLQPGETYYYRVVAENRVSETTTNANEGKPVDGPIGSFTTFPAPSATTGAAGAITGTSAALSGEVNPEGAVATYSFEYVSKTAYETAVAEGAANPYAAGETTAPRSAGSGEAAEPVGPVPATNLRPGETYHYRLLATNSSGAQGIGAEATFTTQPATPPLAGTGAASGVTQSSATLSGTVTTNGLPTSYAFEIGTGPEVYGPPTGIGSVGGAATEEVSATLTGLQPGTTYYYRLRATNIDGTVPGQPLNFTTAGLPYLLTVPPSGAALIPFEPVSQIQATQEAEDNKHAHPPGLTNKQKLAKALKACRKDRKKSKRTKCEKQARAKYAPGKKK